MDYIQQDLDLIRTATGDADEEVKKQTVKKKKSTPKRAGVPSKSEKGMASAKRSGPKKTKPILPVKIKEETKVIEKKEKKGRKSISSPSLGKIKLPFIKKQQQAGASEASPTLSKDKKLVHKQQQAEVSEASPTLSRVKKMTPSTKSEKPIEPQTIVIKKESSTPTPAPAKGKRGIDPNATPVEAIRFVEGAKIEAVDSGKWYRAKIVKVDEDKMDVLVHFDGWGARFDTWFPMTSALIRGRTQLDEKPDILKFEEGEDVLAKWSDGNFYPATVLKLAKSGSCNVMFFDGLKKSLRPTHLKKMTEKEKEEAMKAVQKLLLIPPEFVSQNSSGSGGSPASDGKRYRTSANDREKRLNARSQEFTPVPVRNAKRKADVLSTSGIKASGQASRDSTDDEAISAKRARLDKITTNLITRVSPTSESRENDKKKVSIHNEEGTPKSSKRKPNIIAVDVQSNEVAVKINTLEDKEVVNARTKKAPVRRGRRPKQRAPHVKASELKELPKSHEADADESPKKETADESPKKETSDKSPEKEKADKSPKKEKADESPVKEKADDEVVETLQENACATTTTLASENLTNKETVTGDGNQQSPEGNRSNEPSFQVSDFVYDESPTGVRIYKPGDIVLAKWADCRSYLAYIVKKESDDSYKIRYYDGHVKVVKATFIHPWIGPLPDTLKIFKPKPPQSKRQRSKSIDLKKSRGRPVTKTTGIGRGLPASAKTRRRTIASISSAKRDSPVARRQRRRSNNGGFGNQYRPNDKVLAKWTDLRWYPATVVKKMDNEHYQVMYADNMTKLVRDTWLSPWTPPKPEDDGSQQDSPTAESSTKANAPKSPKDESVGGTGKISIQFLPGRTVLARYTDGISYPATVKEKLDGGKYLVEYDNGVMHKVKFSAMNPWSKTALPPLKKQVMRKLYQPKMAQTLQKPQIIELLKQEKHEQAKSASSPKQAVHGHDAHLAKSPAQEAPDTDLHKFKCKVPGCTKSFRKEEMLRTHHKHYHQQRYKLRDQDGLPMTTKKKTQKDEVARRRVSADYEVTPKPATTAEEDIVSIPKSRGAKPPIEIYQRHHEQSKALSQSPITSSSSSAEDAKVVDKQPIVKQSEIPVQPVEAKPSFTMTTRKRRLSCDVKEDEAKVQTPQQEKRSDLPENDTDEDNEASSDPINEDVIRCTCNMDEEEGFMIQCETCFTWQHAACIGVKRTDNKKEKHRDEKTRKFKTTGKREKAVDRPGKLQASSDGYICWVCKHPQNVRRSRKYHYNNEFLAKGKLPSLVNPSAVQPDEAMNPRIRDVALMMEEIVKMQESIVGIKNMIKIVSTPSHPLLKTWDEPVKKRRVTRSANGNEASKSPNNQDQSSKLVPSVKPKPGIGNNQLSPSQSGSTNRKTDILRQKENLLDHVTELEAELDSRITKLIDYISKLNENLGDEDTSNSLQEDLTTVQRLLKNR